ncbi:Clavaminate synthase-like protein [Tilletiaria anomala UBC 951]|uniref:Clavaminate synthase-like protein n=1 Tax=Tilletiaria anomala (strain ATCC 24038 / CBS 436.72 / UBC 951) TaxID=1037660 RepID=A0A066VYB7_TILAU|nr:Clavaminate synthase-like protein [Tilletiaria anomala UBC 951]KDN45278.1 Clavaminate synthase-like protein [Tilletiaria anomala UBC 951]
MNASKPAFQLEHAASGTRLRPSADGRGILVKQISHPDLPPVEVSYAWLLDSDQSKHNIHPTTSQKFFHSSDAVHAVEGVKDQALDLRTPPYIEQDTLVLTLSPDIQITNAFSQTFCAPSTATSRTAIPTMASPREIRIPLPLLRAHTDAAAYDVWHADVLGLAQPWLSASLAGAKDGSAGPLLIDWNQIGLPESELQRHLTDTMIPVSAGGEGSIASAETTKRLAALHTLTYTLLRDGLAFVTSVPTQTTASVPFNTANQNGGNMKERKVAMLYHVARLLGEIRATFYGPALWDVRSMRQSKNIANTNSDLGFHADLCYFANPPRFQFLHMLRNQVQGGKSLFVDGFAVAKEMWRKHRDEFMALATTPVSFHYNNDGRYYRFAHPTIELAQPYQGFASSSTASFPHLPAGKTACLTPPIASSNSSSNQHEDAEDPMPRLVAINYSPPFQSPLPLHPSPSPPSGGRGADSPLFRRALSTFARLTHDVRFAHVRQMSPGECVIFDNRRVLHSRTGFEWDENEEACTSGGGGGELDQVRRWLKGCYVEGDAVWSTYRVLSAHIQALKQRE